MLFFNATPEENEEKNMTIRKILAGCGALVAACSHPSPPAATTPAVPAAAAAPARPAAPAAPTDAAGLLAQYKAATGGAKWDSLTSLSTKGSLSAGGLTGTIESLVDARTGRSTEQYQLGP